MKLMKKKEKLYLWICLMATYIIVKFLPFFPEIIFSQINSGVNKYQMYIQKS